MKQDFEELDYVQSSNENQCKMWISGNILQIDYLELRTKSFGLQIWQSERKEGNSCYSILFIMRNITLFHEISIFLKTTNSQNHTFFSTLEWNLHLDTKNKLNHLSIPLKLRYFPLPKKFRSIYNEFHPQKQNNLIQLCATQLQQ